MLRQAEEKTKSLQGASLDLAGTFEQVGSLASDMKSDVASMSASIVEATIKTAQFMSGSTEQISNLRQVWGTLVTYMDQALPAAAVSTGVALRQLYPSWKQLEEASSKVAATFEWSVEAVLTTQLAMGPAAREVGILTQSLDTLTEAVNQAAPGAGGGIDRIGEAIEDIRNQAGPAAGGIDKLAQSLREFTLDATMQWTSYYDDVEEKAANFVTDREQLETDHLEKLEELRKRGQAKTITIDEEAELAKLANLQNKLAIALQSQAEFTENTALSTRMRKDAEIATLQTGITDQEKLLDDYYSGRLIKAGENVNALIGEENRRHTEAVAGLEAEIAKTKELQRQQLGTLMLDTFETWAEIADVPPKEMLEMRTAIAKEYGLISEEEAQLIGLSLGTWETWQDHMYTNTEQTATQLGKDIEQVRALQEALGELPDMKVIEVMIKHSGSYNPYPTQESVPEVVPGTFFVPPASNPTYNFNQTVNTQATAANVLLDWQTAQALVQ
jgi:hypothetical protein